MIKPKLLFLGAATFLAAHAVEAAAWSAWFYGVYAPWFLNSGRAVAFTAASLMAAAAIVAIVSDSRLPWLVAGLNLAVGAVGAMIVVLFTVGPGTLFPIAIATGAAVVGVSSLAGALAGLAVRYATVREPRT